MADIHGISAECISLYKERGYWEPLLTADYWDANAENHPHERAIVDSGGELSWSEVKVRSDRLALACLELGIQRDQVVLCQLPNGSDFLILRLALLKAGILCCQPAMTLRHREMEYILERTEAVAVVIPWESRGFNYLQMMGKLREKLPALRHVILSGPQAPPDVISLNEVYAGNREQRYPEGYLQTTKYRFDEFTHIAVTSGSTGVPKLVTQSDAAIKLSAKDTARRVEMTRDDVISIFAPLSGGAANVLAFYCAPLVGAPVLLPESFEPTVLLRHIEQCRPTIICSVPTVLIRMLRDPEFDRYDLSSLRAVFSYGSPIAYQTAREVEERLDSVLISRYGAFDIAAISCTSLNDEPEVRLTSAGKPYSGCEIRLYGEDGREVPPGEEGEIWVRGPTATHGFYRDDDATDRTWNIPGREGWGCTGDTGRFDPEGNLCIVGRKKDVIIRGGQNIFPREIETILRTHGAVIDAAVLGYADPEMGERVCAFLVLKAGLTLRLDEIAAFFKAEGVASFKIPERLVMLDRLPLVSDHKVDYSALERHLEG